MRYFLIAVLLAALIGTSAAVSMDVSGGTVNRAVTVTLDEPAFIIFQLDGGVPIYAYGTSARFLPHTTGTLSITADAGTGPVTSTLQIVSGGGTPGGGGGDEEDTTEPWQTVTLGSGTFTMTAEEGTIFSVDRRTALGALHASGTSYTISDAWWESYGSLYLTSVDGRRNEGVSGWMFQVNGATPGTGANTCTVKDGDEVIFYFSESMSSTPSTSSDVIYLRVSIPASSGERDTGSSTGSPTTILTKKSAANSHESHLLGLPAGAELKITASGLYLSIDLEMCEAAGEDVAMDLNNLIITRENHVMTIRFFDFTEKNGVISGYVERITVRTLPTITDLSLRGEVSAEITADLFVVPVDAEIRLELFDTPPDAMREIFSRAAAAAGFHIEEIGYVMVVQTVHLAEGEDIGPATITMSISPEWVNMQGGPKAVRILRIDDEQGCEILQTTFAGNEEGRGMLFTASSPRGLSTFGLVALGEGAPSFDEELRTGEEGPESGVPPEQFAATVPSGWIPQPIITGGAIVILLAGLVLLWRVRR